MAGLGRWLRTGALAVGLVVGLPTAALAEPGVGVDAASPQTQALIGENLTDTALQSISCPAGQALIGLNFWRGHVFDYTLFDGTGLQGSCGVIGSDMSVTPTGATLGALASGVPSSPNDSQRCPAGKVMTGWKAFSSETYNPSIARLELYCSSASLAKPSTVTVAAPAASGITVGVAALDNLSPAACPSGTVAVGFNARVKVSLEQVQLVCQPLVAQALSVTVNADVAPASYAGFGLTITDAKGSTVLPGPGTAKENSVLLRTGSYGTAPLVPANYQLTSNTCPASLTMAARSNQACVVTVALKRPKLALTVAAPSPALVVGVRSTYGLTVGNTGSSPAGTAQVKMRLPAGMALVSGTGTGWTCAADGANLVTCAYTGSIAVGGTSTVTLTVQPGAALGGTSVAPAASIGQDGGAAPTPGTCTNPAECTTAPATGAGGVGSGVRLAMAASAPVPALTVGLPSAYTLTVSNGGTGPAPAAQVRMQLPAGLTLVSGTGTGWTCAADATHLATCNFAGSIAAGGTSSLVLTVKPTAALAGANVAPAASIGQSGGPAPVPGSCTNPAECVTAPATGAGGVGAGIHLVLSASVPTPALVAGTASSYTLTVTNNGTGAAGSAQVQMQLPAGLDLVSGTGSGWNCAADGARLVTCNFTGAIAAGGSSTLNLSVRPTATIAGSTVAPAASIGEDGNAAPTPGSCARPAECITFPGGGTVGSGISLGLTAAGPAPGMVVGSTSTFTLTVTNTGTGAASSAQVKLQLPVGLDLVSGTGTGWTCAANGANLVTCNFTGSIPVSGSSNVALAIKPTALAAGTSVSPTASIGQDGGLAPAPGNCARPAECVTFPGGGTVGSGISLGLSAAGPAPGLVVGATSTFTLTVTNTGTGAASSAQVKLQLPAGMDLVSGAGTGWTCAANGANLITCNFLGPIPAGDSSNVILAIKPTALAAGTSVAPSASIGQDGGLAPAPDNCARPAECVTFPGGGAVGSGISLGLSAAGPAPGLVVGSTSTFTLTVTNTGTGAASSAQVKLQLPDGIDLVSGTGTGWTCAANGANLVTCNFVGSIPAGDSSNVILAIKPTALAAGTSVAPSASIGQDGGLAPAPGNCARPAECVTFPGGGTVGSGVSLGLSAAGPAPGLVVGATSTFTLTVTNTGTGAASSAQVKLQLPAGMDLVSGAGTGWTCAANGATLVTCNFLGSLPAGGSSTVAVSVKPTAAMAGSTATPAASIGKDGNAAPAPGSCATPAECITFPGSGAIGSGVSLGLAASAPAPGLVVGATSSFTLTVTNNGTGRASSAQVKLQLPVGMDFVSGTGTGWTCAANGANLVTCDFVGSLHAGGSSTVAVSVKPTAAMAGSTATPAASIGQDGSAAPAPGNCATPAECITFPGSGAIGSGVNLGLAASAPAPGLVVGATSTYTLTVTNSGTGAASSAQAKLQLPDGMDLVSGTGTGWSCTADGTRLVTCNFSGAIAAGGSSTLALSVKPTATISGSTAAPAASIGQDGNAAPAPGNCATSAECITFPSSGAIGSGVSLGLSAAGPAPGLVVGATSTYTLTVTNSGTGAASSAQLKLQLPAGMDFVSGTGTGWTCTANGANLVTCNFAGSIPAGGSSTVSVSVKPTAAMAGSTATPAASIGQDGGPAPAPGTCTTPAECITFPGSNAVAPGISLGLSASAPVPALVVGAASTFTVTVTNHGTGAASSAQVKLQLPDGMDLVSGTGTGWTCAADGSHLVTCNFLGALPAGGFTTVAVSVKPTVAMAGSTASPTASIGQDGGPAPAPGNCALSAECITFPGIGAIGSGAHLGLSASAPVPALAVGTTSTYTLTVTNDGTGPAKLAQVQVQLPAGMTLVSGTGTGWSCAASGSGLVTCDFAGSLPPGGSGTVALSVAPAAALAGANVTPTASIGQDGGPAPAPGNCAQAAECISFSSSGAIGSGISLGLAASAPVPALMVGTTSVYTLTVTNHGSGAATSAQVKMQLPAGMALVSGTGSGWTCAAGGAGLVTCDFGGAIPAGGSSTVALAVTPAAGSAGASAAPGASVGRDGGPAPQPGQCTQPAECITFPASGIASGVSLGLAASAPVPALMVGTTSTYTLTVTNHGTGSTGAAQIKLRLPDSIGLVSITGAGWICAADAADLVTCNFTGTIPAGGTSTLALSVQPTAAPSGTGAAPAASIGREGGPAPAPGACTDPSDCLTFAGAGSIASGVRLGLSSSAPVPALVVGSRSTYTLSVTNGGTGTAHAAQVRVRLPAGMALVSGTGTGWTCVEDPSELTTCDFTGSIAPGGTSTVALSVRPAPALAGASVAPDGAIGQAGGPAPAPGSCANPAECITFPAGSAIGSGVMLSLSASAPVPALVVGVTSTYTLTVTNKGTGPASSAQLRLRLPAGMNLVSAAGAGTARSRSADTAWTCATDASQLLACRFAGSIAAGGSTALAISVEPAATLAGASPVLAASIGQAGAAAPAPNDCTDPAECVAIAGAGAGGVGSGISLGLSVSAPQPALVVGLPSTYTLTVANKGTGPASAAQVKVRLPSGMGFVSGTGAGWTCAADGTGPVACSFAGTIPAGGSTTLAFSVIPTVAMGGASLAPAVSIGQDGGPAPTPGDCANPAECVDATGAGAVGSGVSLALTAAAPVPALAVGVPSTYALAVTNHGTGPASAAQVKLQLPPDMGPASGTGTGWTCAADAARLMTCDFSGTIAAGGSSALALTVQPTAALAGSNVALAASIGQDGGPAPDPGRCSRPSECVTLPGAGSVASGVSLGLSSSAPVPALVVAVQSRYTLTVTNHGTGPANAAQVKMQLPAGMDPVSGTGTGWVCTADAGRLVTCNFSGSIATGGSSTVVLTVQPTAAAAGASLTTSASIGRDGGPAPAPGSCSLPAECITAGGGGAVGTGVGLVLSASMPAPALVVGSTSAYTLTVHNHGTATATSAQVRAQLPAAIALVSATGAGWTCAADGASLVTCDYAGAIPPGGSSTVVLSVRPTAAIAGTSVQPSASIGQDGGPAPAPGSCARPAECIAFPAGGAVGTGVGLALSVSPPAPALVVGTTSTYMLTVTNTGSAVATAAQVKMQLPAGITLVSGTGAGWTCAADGANLVTCDYAGAIPVGGSSTVVLSVRPTTAAAGTSVAPTASIGQDGGPAPHPSHCTSPAECQTVTDAGGAGTTVGSGVVLSLQVSAPTPALVVGTESVYTLTVRHEGTAAATAQVKMQLPAGLELVAATGTGWRCQADGGQAVTCDFDGAMAPGGGGTIAVQVKPSPALAGAEVVVLASIGRTGGPAPAPGACADPAECASSPGTDGATVLGHGVALSLATSAPTPALALGTESTYVLTVTNRGEAAATSAQTLTQLPDGMRLQEASGVMDGGGAQWVCAPETAGLVACNVASGAIAPRQGSSAVALRVQPGPELIGRQVLLRSSVGQDGGAAPPPGADCPDPAACSSSPARMVGASATLLVDKRANKQQASVGDVVQYTVRVANPGAGPVDGLKIDDRLPPGFRYIAGTAQLRLGYEPATPAADPTGAPGPRLSFALGTLAAGQSAELSYRVRIGIGGERHAGTNSAQALAAGGVKSGVARATVKVAGGVFSTDACILGKVYADCNRDRMQGSGERGIPQARVYLEDGTSITTDGNGNFSICGMRPITHVMRVEPASLPAGATMLMSSNRNAGDAQSLFVDLKKGELHRADFPVDACSPAQQDDIRQRGQALQKAEQERRLPREFGLQFNSDRNLRSGLPRR